MRGILLLGGGGAAVLVAGVALAATSERLATLTAAEQAIEADQSKTTTTLARLLSVVEQLKRDPPPALLVSPDDARDAVRAAILVKAMTPVLQGQARTYARGQGEVMRQRRLAAVQSEALFERDSLAAEQLPEPQRDPPPGQATSAGAPPVPPARLIVPAQGPVTRRFGDALPGGGRANGLTVEAARGARVVSPAEGLVQYVGPVKGWGVILILRLAGGYHLVLAGLDRTSVGAGQSVAAGQPVGWAPDGRQSSSELYLELRAEGTPVDPARWMNKTSG
jgi:septal ring factor EnvC (AmiA/AmiB activator)